MLVADLPQTIARWVTYILVVNGFVYAKMDCGDTYWDIAS
jgi:hypothetical protein